MRNKLNQVNNLKTIVERYIINEISIIPLI